LYDQPTASELLGAVAGFLRDEVSPTLSGRLAFHARVAVNVLEMVRRELALGPTAVEGEAARLKALLGRDGSTAELEAAFCEAIASDKLDPDDPALIDHLWATTLDTLAVDQPNYATYRRAVAKTAAPSTPSGSPSPRGGGEPPS
jgi:hypothetical protein